MKKMDSIQDIPECIGEITTRDQFIHFIETILDMDNYSHGYDIDTQPEGVLIDAICKNKYSNLLMWLIECDFNGEFYDCYATCAEIIRSACRYDWKECIDIMIKRKLEYSLIRNECYQYPNFGAPCFDEDMSSPLVFAAEENALGCYKTLLKWMYESGETIEKEGKTMWLGYYHWEPLQEVLKKKGLSWSIEIMDL